MLLLVDDMYVLTNFIITFIISLYVFIFFSRWYRYDMLLFMKILPKVIYFIIEFCYEFIGANYLIFDDVDDKRMELCFAYLFYL
jgi:hypothetical protein